MGVSGGRLGGYDGGTPSSARAQKVDSWTRSEDSVAHCASCMLERFVVVLFDGEGARLARQVNT